MSSFNFILDFILNLIFIGIPQTLVIGLVILFLLKDYHFFLRNYFKRTCLDVLIFFSLPCSLFMNSIYYFLELESLFRISLNSLIIYFFMVHLFKTIVYRNFDEDKVKNASDFRVGKQGDLKQIHRETRRYSFSYSNDWDYNEKINVHIKGKWQILFFSIFVLAVLTMLEGCVIFYLQYFFNMDLNTISSNIINSIFISYPSLFLLLSSIYMGYVCYNNRNITFVKVWLRNKHLRITTYIQCFTTSAFVFYIHNKFSVNNALKNFESDITLRISIILYVILILHILIPQIFILYKKRS